MDDDYTVFGTPLPDLDEDDIVSKKVAEDLTVRDEKGRQRFHGAFTGGFSAGYFNTVGTKEGWTPSTFVSSRAKKNDYTGIQQNPEDFMDDEDLGEFGIAPKKIQTTCNFRDITTDRSSRKREHQPRYQDHGIIPGEAPLKDLVKPVLESIGITILKKMGWRQGQGIGPRVTKPNVKLYGCSLGPLAANNIGGITNLSEAITFAPEDSSAVHYVVKDDYHGIGYTGLSVESVLGTPKSNDFSTSSTKSWLPKDKKILKISGQAFGVGALEDDDDYEIYSKDDMSQYDFSEFTGETKKKGAQNLLGDQHKKDSGNVLQQGFCIASKSKVKTNQYPPPELPPGYQPLRKAMSSTPSSSNSVSSNSFEINKQKLDPNIRSMLLGEKKFVRAAEPVLQTAPAKRKSRFDVAPGQTSDHPPPGLVVTSDFKPFAREKDKQKRYDEFLQHNCDKDHLRLIQPFSMTEWEKRQELDEFLKASTFYKPMSKALSSHFISTSDLHLDLVPVLPEIKANKSKVTSSSKTITEVNRKTFEWHPTKILCKRFNVPNPFPDSQHEGVPNQEKKKTSLFGCISFEGMEKEVSKTDIDCIPQPHTSMHGQLTSEKNDGTSKTPVQIKNKIEDNPKKLEIEISKENSKPPMDLFKDIFHTSSEEEETEPSDNENNDVITSTTLPKFEITESSTGDKSAKETKSNVPDKKVAFGVFANLDLDALNRRKTDQDRCEYQDTLSSKDDDLIPRKSEESDVPASTPETSFYGPEPPPQGTVIASYSLRSPTNSHFGHKHKHKHNKVKKKKKEKKKKHRKHKESSDSDSNSDVPPEKIIEKLKELQKMGKSCRKKS